MLRSAHFLPLVFAVAVSGCAQTAISPAEVTRADTSTLAFQATDKSGLALQSQADSLNDMAAGIVRASTVKGAMIGAAVGCGIAIATASGSEKCVTGALVGGAGGAAVGNIVGKKDVARRVEIANPNALVRSIRRSNDKLAKVQTGLPAHLAAQDAQLKRLKAGLANGTVSQEGYDKSVADIRDNRAQLAEALTLTASQARTATTNLESAATQGQTGLEWHIMATSKLERDTVSARSSIGLL
ncbi:MAG: hypothetical protein WA790_17965 [Sulfitobacter sp.]